MHLAAACTNGKLLPNMERMEPFNVIYQTADLGIAPYDYLSLGLRDYTPCPYFGCRIFTDALSALLCWLLGGLVGLGTLICAFCLGPFIQFFDRTFSQKVLQYKPNN